MTNTEATLRAAADELAVALLARNRAIRDMRRQGASLRQIADAANLSHTAVAKILSRE